VIVVGGGPAGLTFAQRALAANKSVLLLEAHSALGGCHRVERVQENFFTEHGPRVYSSAYRTFKDILQDIGLDFHALFTRYDIQISNIGGRTLRSMHMYELIPFVYAFFLLIFNPDYGSDMTMEDFARQYRFSQGTKEYIDRLCRMTDGASISRYTLNEFLNLMNQQSLYSLYQPKEPNDTGLFRLWMSALRQRGLHLKLQTPVTHIARRSGSTGLMVNGKYTAKQVILALPPQSLVKLLQSIPDPYIKNNFGDVSRLSQWASQTEYIQYIPITFHWVGKKLQLPKIWGFPASDWGVAFIVLSDYFEDDHQNTTLISAAITYQHRISSALGKTAAQCSRSELISETFRQLCESYPRGTDIPPPTKSIISPDVHYSTEESEYRNINNAYLFRGRHSTLPPFGIYVPNLFTLGTHNNENKYRFTSLESAVQNAVYLSNELYYYPPHNHNMGMMMVKGPIMLTDILFPILCALCVILIMMIFFINFKVKVSISV